MPPPCCWLAFPSIPALLLIGLHAITPCRLNRFGLIIPLFCDTAIGYSGSIHGILSDGSPHDGRNFTGLAVSIFIRYSCNHTHLYTHLHTPNTHTYTHTYTHSATHGQKRSLLTRSTVYYEFAGETRSVILQEGSTLRILTDTVGL